VRIPRTVVGAAAVAGLLTATLTGAAHADTNTTSNTAAAAIGSDTADDVMDGLTALSSLNTKIANYQTVPVGGDVDLTPNYHGTGLPAGADCNITRPRGSGEGKTGLVASMTDGAFNPAAGTNGSTNFGACAAVARSSSASFPTGAPSGSIAKIPYATDAVAPAVLKASTAAHKFSFTFLKELYTRNGVAGSADCLGYVPMIPQATSGTRSFWASSLGVTDYDFSGTGGTVAAPPANKQTWGSCVTGGAPNPLGTNPTKSGNGNPGDRLGGPTGTAIQEHDGRVLSDSSVKQMIPYSVAQYVAEGAAIPSSGDIRGGAVLASVDFTSATNTPSNANLKHPYALNGVNSASVGFSGATGNLTREIFNFVPRTLVDSAYTPDAAQKEFTGVSAADVTRFQQAFVGSTSDICSAGSTILEYGFATDPNCGSVTFNP
jgi:hypothetical protein